MMMNMMMVIDGRNVGSAIKLHAEDPIYLWQRSAGQAIGHLVLGIREKFSIKVCLSTYVGRRNNASTRLERHNVVRGSETVERLIAGRGTCAAGHWLTVDAV